MKLGEKKKRFPGVVFKPAAASSPGNFSKMSIPGTSPKPAESGPLGVGPTVSTRGFCGLLKGLEKSSHPALSPWEKEEGAHYLCRMDEKPLSPERCPSDSAVNGTRAPLGLGGGQGLGTCSLLSRGV